jgi:hypothetical protein
MPSNYNLDLGDCNTHLLVEFLLQSLEEKMLDGEVDPPLT